MELHFDLGAGMQDSEDDQTEQEQEVDIERDDDKTSKRRKLSEEERLRRCRERNRIHARNTRERKRIQMEALQLRIQELTDEKLRLKNVIPDASVASILMSLSVANSNEKTEFHEYEENISSSAKMHTSLTIENLRSQISAVLSGDEELDVDNSLLFKDKSSCTTTELELIRRERNRMHAKKTRLRKKKMLIEMETIIRNLEREVNQLRKENNSTSSLFEESYSQQEQRNDDKEDQSKQLHTKNLKSESAGVSNNIQTFHPTAFNNIPDKELHDNKISRRANKESSHPNLSTDSLTFQSSNSESSMERHLVQNHAIKLNDRNKTALLSSQSTSPLCIPHNLHSNNSMSLSSETTSNEKNSDECSGSNDKNSEEGSGNNDKNSDEDCIPISFQRTMSMDKKAFAPSLLSLSHDSHLWTNPFDNASRNESTNEGRANAAINMNHSPKQSKATAHPLDHPSHGIRSGHGLS